MASDLIVVRLVGSDSDEGDVRLSDFIDQLSAIKDVLRETGHAIYGREAPEMEFKIVGLKRSSPATVTIKPIVPRGEKSRIAKICNGFVSGLSTIKIKKKAPAHADLATLESYRNLATPLQKHIQRVEISRDTDKVVSIDRSFRETVTDIIGPDLESTGSVSGFLEKVNLHNGNRFDIYPKVGPRRVQCSFSEDQMEKVREGLKRHVTVSGKLRYKSWDKFPYAVNVKLIDVHEQDRDLPSIFDLQGLAAGITGDVSSEEFVRTIRERDW
jgi:hypothetical protein